MMFRNIICGVVIAAALAASTAAIIEVWRMHQAYATASARAHVLQEEVNVLREENESLKRLDHTERLEKIAQLCDLNQPLEPSSWSWDR